MIVILILHPLRDIHQTLKNSSHRLLRDADQKSPDKQPIQDLLEVKVHTD